MLRPTLLTMALLLTACTAEEGTAGPCIHRFQGPVLTLTEATWNGDQVDRIEVLSIRRDGEIAELTDTSGLQIGPQGLVTCMLPCAFGEDPGRWQVDVRGPDGSQGFVDVAADYSDSEGSCPSYSFDGLEVAVTLTSGD